MRIVAGAAEERMQGQPSTQANTRHCEQQPSTKATRAQQPNLGVSDDPLWQSNSCRQSQACKDSGAPSSPG
eukprot:364505-Chlamydomonas_euryale.AAC.12